MKLFQSLSLRHLLTVPYVMLVLVLALTIGSLSYTAGRDAVDKVSDRLMSEMVFRISQAVERHVFGAAAVLETAFPTGVAAPTTIEADLAALRTRFWLATSVHREPNNYAYYGSRTGEFFGLWRASETDGELRIRTSNSGPRTIYHFSGINGALTNPVQEARIFDPRERPWYLAGQTTQLHTWTSIYIDFKTEELVMTRARRVTDAQGQFQGVVATDLSLQRVEDFLHTLDLTDSGLAFIVENDGNLIASSRGAYLRKDASGNNIRLNAAHSDDAFVVSTYQYIRSLQAQDDHASNPKTVIFTDPTGQAVQATFGKVYDTAGLDWTIIVAVPRKNVLGGIPEIAYRTALLTCVAVLAVIVIGLLVLKHVRHQFQRLANAARAFGDGNYETLFNIYRTDELGDLARSFGVMRHKLLTDKLTGLANREACMYYIQRRITEQPGDGTQVWAVLFIDLNYFKTVNDRYGHDAGDAVLRSVARRLEARLGSAAIVARYAGDEFAAIVPIDRDQQAAAQLCTDLEALLRAPPIDQVPAMREPLDGAAVGIAFYPDDGLDAAALIAAADTAMYKHKRAAR